MLNFLPKQSLQLKPFTLSFPKISCILQSHRFCSDISNNNIDNSFLVSVLIESCGLSRDTASKAAKYVCLKNPSKPKKVLAFFRSQGFSDAQISRVVKSCAQVLGCTPERTLLPKFEFFHSKGISKSEIAQLCSICPRILSRSLQKCIIPFFEYYKEHLFISDEKIVAALKRHPAFLYANPEVKLAPIIDVFQDYGVPRSNFVKLFCQEPRYLYISSDALRRNIEKLKEMGFDPQSKMFVVALIVMMGLSKTSWQKKVSVYKNWGWSEETIMTAFLKYPFFMTKSEEKVAAVMDHFVNKLGCDPLLLARYSVIFSYSMEGRIIPRTAVLEFLQEKGMLSKDLGWMYPLIASEKLFVERFIYRYEKEVPGLLKMYESAMRTSVG